MTILGKCLDSKPSGIWSLRALLKKFFKKKIVKKIDKLSIMS